MSFMGVEYTPFSDDCNTLWGIHRLVLMCANGFMRIDEIRRGNLAAYCDRECGGNQAELARRAQRKPNQIADMLAGRKAFGEKVAREIERNLGMPPNQLDHQTQALAAAPPLRGRVPVISDVQAGHFTEMVDNYHPGDADEWVDVSCAVNRHTFALVVTGDSMEPEFPAGVRVVVEPDMQFENGDYVVAGNGEGATLKQIVRDGNDWYLKPLNDRYPIKPLGNARVIGVVRQMIKTFR